MVNERLRRFCCRVNDALGSADAVHLLALDSSLMTGQVVVADGGRTM